VTTPAFHAVVPTRVVGGSGVIATLPDWVRTYGDRPLVIIGEGHVRASGLLAQIEGVLQAGAHTAFELLEGVPSNPGVAVVDAGAALARVHRSDVIVAVGGGSVIDVAKAIAVAALGDGRTFRDHLSGARARDLLVDAALPVVAIPTLPGSGSETNGTSVITDEQTGGKWSAHSDLAAPRVALLDTDLLLDAPASLIGPGLVDAWCHALEAALSARASVASDLFAEQAMRTIRTDISVACDPADPARTAALLRCWWASNLASQALTWAGSIVTHPLAHAVSAITGARHADAVAAVEPAVLASFADRFRTDARISTIARWLDVRRPDDPDDAIRGVISRFARVAREGGTDRSLAQLGINAKQFPDLVRAARESGSRGLSNVPGGEPSADELFAVLDLALDRSPIAPARSWLEA
jgi:alcohol dehydrogenase class IV